MPPEPSCRETSICALEKKANATRALLQRNIYISPRKTKEMCYTTLVRPITEYGSIIGCVALFWLPITPTAHYSDGPFFRQCKIELNPQIHGLTRCIQQDVPSVRLILTDHGLDRMFWKGKGAFILGCTSPFKAIMIDRPGMGKVKNWRKSCAHCTKEPEKRSEGKKCKPGEARERQNDGR